MGEILLGSSGAIKNGLRFFFGRNDQPAMAGMTETSFCRFSRIRMSSSFTKMLAKRLTLTSASRMRSFTPGNRWSMCLINCSTKLPLTVTACAMIRIPRAGPPGRLYRAINQKLNNSCEFAAIPTLAPKKDPGMSIESFCKPGARF